MQVWVPKGVGVERLRPFQTERSPLGQLAAASGPPGHRASVPKRQHWSRGHSPAARCPGTRSVFREENRFSASSSQEKGAGWKPVH